MLVLLIIFMVSAPLLNVGVPVDLPKTEAGAMQDAEKPVAVTIAKDGALHLNETETTLAALIPRLQEMPEAKGKPIYVRADGGAPYAIVAQVMAKLSTSGFTKLNLVTDVAAPEGTGALRRGMRERQDRYPALAGSALLHGALLAAALVTLSKPPKPHHAGGGGAGQHRRLRPAVPRRAEGGGGGGRVSARTRADARTRVPRPDAAPKPTPAPAPPQPKPLAPPPKPVPPKPAPAPPKPAPTPKPDRQSPSRTPRPRRRSPRPSPSPRPSRS